jgi:fatty acid desaturase
MVLFTYIAKGLITLLEVPFIDRFITFTTILTNGYSMLIHECSHFLFQNIMLFNEFVIEVL